MANVGVNKNPWINPVGGIGDAIMLSGVLKLFHDKYPERKFNLVRRTQYTQVFKGHPAIEKIGFPASNDKIIETNYWNIEQIGGGQQRAFQILSRAIGLETPIEEKLYLPNLNGENKVLFQNIPWKKKNIIFAPFSNSPRKNMHPIHWHQLIEKLSGNKDVLIIQTGRINETHIKNAFSLLGVTELRELISIVKKSDLVISPDSLLMHVAKLTGTPAIIIWGPTPTEVYGYDSHVQFTGPVENCHLKTQCLGADFPNNYLTPCPLNDNGHCMNKINIDELYQACIKILN